MGSLVQAHPEAQKDQSSALVFFVFCLNLRIESRKRLYTVFVVGNTACLPTTVHGENGIAHIHASQWEGRGKDVAKSAAASHVAVVYKTLAWDICLTAYLGKHCRRNGIARILLGGIELNDGTAAKNRMVRRVVFLTVVWMPSVGIVCRNHKGTLYCLMERLSRAALRQTDALQHRCKERTAGTLFCLRTRFLVVEDGKNFRCLTSRCRQ